MKIYVLVDLLDAPVRQRIFATRTDARVGFIKYLRQITHDECTTHEWTDYDNSNYADCIQQLSAALNGWCGIESCEVDDETINKIKEMNQMTIYALIDHESDPELQGIFATTEDARLGFIKYLRRATEDDCTKPEWRDENNSTYATCIKDMGTMLCCWFGIEPCEISEETINKLKEMTAHEQ